MKKQIAKNTAQQGDVNFRRVSELPEGDHKIVSKKRCVVAEGEHTGHAHVIEDSGAQLILIGEKFYLSLEKAATVTHEEHKPITLSPGVWEVGRVQEFDYFQKMQRQVQD